MGAEEITASWRLEPSITADGRNYRGFVEVSEHNLMTCAICERAGHCFNQHDDMSVISLIQRGIPMSARDSGDAG